MQIKRKFAAIFLLNLIFTSGCDDSKKAIPHTAQPEVGVVTLKAESVNVTSKLPGRIVPFEIAEIRPQVGGIILSRLFKEGSKVNKGESLYLIDPTPLQAELDRAKANLAKMQSAADNARLMFNRFSSLLKSHYVSRQDYDTAQANVKEAEANLLVAKAAVESAKINLNYASVTSPFSGLSGKSTVTPGALVVANQEQALVTVQRLDPVYVDVTQSANEFLQLKTDMEQGLIEQNQGQATAWLELDNGKRYAHAGKLQFSDLTVDETTGSVTLRAIFPNPDNALLPGMYVTAVLNEGTQHHVLLVPQEAVTRNDSGKAIAFILDSENIARQREINTSKAIGDKWLVTSGLQPGDRVIVSGLQKIRPGIKAHALYTPTKSYAPLPQ
ncbi:efflux transporter periplasmic adaptor subunit [Citrobacter amalonaticus]|uniref:Efflux transporter periplasmic adaptor subunit n=1 Tax=Citrobacter amalonaticus TaxID=35703 RepID=A0A2S4RRL9_CITAM|nr:efflux RND transporter periplasmic adaptor subunit [Citrobacter amalonaticus]POT58610.1 efflux transporter periplasmic adaptor subunit [Citrobacter amalonaticus]POT70348.1 efflux transporter periplasmic adaptor subunit [Citrobacter amalonaticus]POU61332.1 efflux transporter periplasmic adaptor subunit [Citrobacter amalonaticus]POV05099.1 efflux transporter periplasmic adaptor subunit [Citrobacter amalonaticus]